MKKEFLDFLHCEKIYKPFQIKEVLKLVRTNFRFAYAQNKKLKYFNVPCSFDIETTSFFRSIGKDEEKIGIMYMWSFGIYGLVIIGRTWEEYINMLSELCEILDLNENKRLIVYVHNLGYEFQFLRKWFEWTNVFCIDTRKPIYALCDNGIEYRCSYLLSGYSLQKIGENLLTYKVEKLVGNLDYKKLRHSKTMLTKEELDYSANDVRVVMSYIQEKIESDGDISKIPITKTGYVRKYCRNSCFYDSDVPRKKSYKRLHYRDFIKELTLEPEEYIQLKNAFQGGFTHANAFYSGKTMYNISSYDLTSSYPTVMVAEQFPMSISEKIVITSMEELEKNLSLYCCLFDIEIIGLESLLFHENYLSISRCRNVRNATVNNGRIVRADFLQTTVTEQDFMIIRKFYTWKKGNCHIYNFRRYKKAYLPTDFVKAILKLYGDKTQLKDVEGKEIEYLGGKEMINAAYGMIVTDIVRPEIKYAEDWVEPEPPNLEEAINKYNKNSSRFLYYPWGVWVTAYARRNLFSAILEAGEDYVYSDTDSVKILNEEKHLQYFEKYNNVIKSLLYKACEYHGISKESIEPKTVKGVKKPLGVWDFDGHYSKFKTIGAKRYLVEYSNDVRNNHSVHGKINITVSGLNKQICVPWMLEQWGDKIFDNFSENLYVPAGYTGKMTHTYIDDCKHGTLTDYNGVKAEYYEKSAVHMEDSDYTLSVSREYSNYIRGVQEK